MRPNSVKTLWAQQQTATCGWASCDSPLIAEAMGQAGLDAVAVDMQHGMTDLQSLPAMLTAIATTQATPMVRLASGAPHEIMKALDAGAYGLICPLVNTAKQAEDLVDAASYPPRGGRSFGPFRARYYGGTDYLDHANDSLLTLAMIETSEGYENLDAILAVEGLDGVFVGPSDLSQNLGVTGDFFNEKCIDAIDKVSAACAKHNIHWGAVTPSPEHAAMVVEKGCKMISPSSDAKLVNVGLQAVKSTFSQYF